MAGKVYKRHNLLILLLVVFAVLLSACDPIGLDYLSVEKVVVANNVPYLHVWVWCSDGMGCGPAEVHYYTSQNYGKTWYEIPPKPFLAVDDGNDEPKVNVISACVPSNMQLCYRLTGNEQIEASQNGGDSWQIDWRMPASRQEYMARNPSLSFLLGVEPDTIPYDLGIIEHDGRYSVIVAMGNQGVMVKQSPENWERYTVFSSSTSVISAIPLPYSATDIFESLEYLQAENTWVFILTCIGFFVLLGNTSRRLRANRNNGAPMERKWSYVPYILAAALFGCFIILIVAEFSFIQISGFGETLSEYLGEHPAYICISPIVLFLVSWALVKICTAPGRKSEAAAFIVSLLWSLAFMLGLWLPFALWTFAILPKYAYALIIAAVAGGIILFWGVRNGIIRIVRWAVGDKIACEGDGLSERGKSDR